MKLAALFPLALSSFRAPLSSPRRCSHPIVDHESPRTPPPFEETLRLLHSCREAASEQQLRLRKANPPADAELGATASAAAGPSVYLVGVGPGDVELLTLKALRVMQAADLVLYDRLISPEILELVNPEAAMLYVGKESGMHTRPQGEIHQLLLQFATSGKTVCRLKGGDPTVFGRGGEEMEYLEAHGVPVAVVPGITAASGIAAQLGVPLTHRDHADAVRFVTGHARSECSDGVAERYSWPTLADPKCTLVIYMGLSTLPHLAAGLLAAGLPASTPAVAVQDGTTPTQRVVAAPLGALHDEVSAAGLRSPTLVIIGQVVSLLKPLGASDYAAAALERGARRLTAEQVLQTLAARRAQA
ncbi:hypothetical protein AB1Y20_001908 [Prymnesium parvum]|uniref:uroporphyrinogen-III C-methyltransferase n=1 Tax=Prymnesium parvum TaxID=97485 RepID=A0AB34J7X1_PRYPA